MVSMGSDVTYLHGSTLVCIMGIVAMFCLLDNLYEGSHNQYTTLFHFDGLDVQFRSLRSKRKEKQSTKCSVVLKTQHFQIADDRVLFSVIQS